MDAAFKKKILEVVSKLLDDPNVTVSWERSTIRTTLLEDVHESYKVGRGQRMTIEIPLDSYKGEFYMPQP